MSKPDAAIIVSITSLLLAGCSEDPSAFGPGEATASETRAISDAAEMAAAPRPTSQTDEPLPQTAGDKAPDQGQ